MRNLLLTTTALVTLYAGVASASTMAAPVMDNGVKVTVGGSLQAQAGFRSQKNDYLMSNTNNYGTVITNKNFKRGVTPGNQNVGFDTVSAMHANVVGKSDAGLTYGAQVGIQATTRSTLPTGSSALDRTFLYMENEMGRVEVGTNSGVSSSMRIGADSIARATGGIDGDWANYVQLNTFAKNAGNYTTAAVSSSNFVMGPTLLLTSASGQNSGTAAANAFQGDEKSRKITYYTPMFNGFQAGLSYTPDNRNTGQDYIDQLQGSTSGYNTTASNGVVKYLPVAKNALAAGINWTGEVAQDQSIKLALVGESATMRSNENDLVAAGQNKYKRVSGAIFGAQYNYQNFAVVASYGTRGKSGYAENVVDANAPANSVSMKAASFWTAGVAYTQGPIGTSLTYMQSNKNKNKLELVSLGMDYQLAPGLLPFAEVTYFSMKQKNAYMVGEGAGTGKNGFTLNQAVVDSSKEYKNKGTAFILGTKLSF